jgi:hypothetical protein
VRSSLELRLFLGPFGPYAKPDTGSNMKIGKTYWLDTAMTPVALSRKRKNQMRRERGKDVLS